MTRADAFVNFTYAVTLLAPLGALYSFRLARARRHTHHRALQLGLVTLCWLAVLLLEARIRLAGGSGSFLRQAPEALQPWGRGLLLVHITFAVATYALWTGLAVISFRRFTTQLPGRFSRLHRTLGRVAFGGLCFTALSATGMYLIAFVA
nr:hypothetical protein Hi04_10k_c3807_00006 [uncultured bacterium]